MHKKPVRCLAVNSNWIISGTDDGYLYLWNLDDRGERFKHGKLKIPKYQYNKEDCAKEIYTNGDVIVCKTFQGARHCWDLKKRKLAFSEDICKKGIDYKQACYFTALPERVNETHIVTDSWISAGFFPGVLSIRSGDLLRYSLYREVLSDSVEYCANVWAGAFANGNHVHLIALEDDWIT